jgi:hypothetical protein
MTIKERLLQVFSEDDGVSLCFAKVSAGIAILSYIGNATYALWLAKSGDGAVFASLGSGLAEVLGGAGALIAAKQATQKKDV